VRARDVLIGVLSFDGPAFVLAAFFDGIASTKKAA